MGTPDDDFPEAPPRRGAGRACAAVLHRAGRRPVGPRPGGQGHPQILVERAEILDQITRYYYNIRNPGPGSFLEYFVEDGELILGPGSIKGKEIAKAFVRAPNNFNAGAFSFNILLVQPADHRDRRHRRLEGDLYRSAAGEGRRPAAHRLSAREYVTW